MKYRCDEFIYRKIKKPEIVYCRLKFEALNISPKSQLNSKTVNIRKRFNRNIPSIIIFSAHSIFFKSKI